MAYTIIGQNNSVTTIDDGNGHTLHVPSRVALAIGTTFTIVEVNNNMATLEDSNGKVYRDIPCVVDLVGSGGGGSSLPDQTGHSGEFLTTDGTDASWAAVDTLPSQTGNTGKFLTTDGTDASWSDKPLVNQAASSTGATIINANGGNRVTGYSNVIVGGGFTYDTSAQFFVSIGSSYDISHQVSSYSVSIIGKAMALRSCAVGTDAKAYTTDSIAIGTDASATGSAAIAIGRNCATNADRAIQIGSSATLQTNSDANTMKVANANGNYEIMSADGTIPSDRLVHAINKYSTMPTAASTNEGWIVQFTGTTDSTYTHGHLYECVSDGQTPATYSWEEVSMGGGGSSYTAGTGIDITGGVISVTSPTLTNQSTAVNSVMLFTGSYSGYPLASNNVIVGYNSKVGYNQGSTSSQNVVVGSTVNIRNATGCIAIGADSGDGSTSSTSYGIAVGKNAKYNADYAIQLGYNATNSDANTFKVANNNGNFEMMSADGTIPAARHASLPATDGTYVLKLVIASGVPTLSWVAE